MSNNIPQYTDIEFVFSNIKYNIDPTTVDLSLAEDIICSVAKWNSSVTPTIIKYTTSPTRFTINNVDKSVKVKFLNTEVGNETGKYLVNLWIVVNSRHATHITESFNIISSIKYS